jgi:hypothetical protein
MRARRHAWLVSVLALLLGCAGEEGGRATAIPDWLFFPSEAITLARQRILGGAGPALGPAGEVERIEAVDFAQPVPHVPVPQHPFMALNAGSNMHNDAYMSDTYEATGPGGRDPVVGARARGVGGDGPPPV